MIEVFLSVGPGLFLSFHRGRWWWDPSESDTEGGGQEGGDNTSTVHVYLRMCVERDVGARGKDRKFTFFLWRYTLCLFV